MSRKKDFAKNTIILFIGKFATQLSSFLLLPLFTHFLLTDDYGWVDLLQTYISLFVPVFTLRMDSAVFRFLIDKRNNNEETKNIISNAVLITIITSTIIGIICIIVGLFIRIKYLIYVLINLVIMMISNVFLQILRGVGKNKEYSICSIITGALNLTLNIILIVLFRYKANSILIASSIANVCVIIYVTLSVKLISQFKIEKYDKKLVKKLLGYSIPMIPNALSWWIVNVSDRTLISIFLGTAYNGIYTVSCKFSNLLNSIFSIFNISWQETASIHINDKDKEKFFSEMITDIFLLFACISLIILVFVSLFYDLIIGKAYIDSYNYIPLLLYANSWDVLISLLGGVYIALKKTKEIAITTIFSALINIFLNFIFIKRIGLYAAVLSTIFAYILMAIYRIIDVKKYVNIQINKKIIVLYTMFFLISYSIYCINNLYLNILNLVFVICFCYIFNKKNIVNILKIIKKKIS